MVAKVNMIYICPKCEEPMSSLERPKKCPVCKFKFNLNPDDLAKELSWPKAPSKQLFEIIQQEVENALPKESKELLPHLNEEQQKEIILGTKQKHSIIKKQWEMKKNEFFFNTDPDDVEELVQCIYFLMNRCISSGNKELIKKCAIWSKKFAEVNAYLEPFIKNGGDTYERTDKSATTRNSA